MSSKNYRKRQKVTEKNRKILNMLGLEESTGSRVKKADVLFSNYIRRRFSNEDGTVTCYTCDKVMNFKESQCGHYIPRGNYATRYLVDNCRPQCKTCNEFMSGNIPEFTKRLEAEVPGITEYLHTLKLEIVHPTRADLGTLIEELKHRLRCDSTEEKLKEPPKLLM